jgi:phospho-N-acetylmuramoyl-pentapeptide-transferase
MISLFTFNIIRILSAAVVCAILGFLITPFLLKYLNKIEFWKKGPREKTITGEKAEVVLSLAKEEKIPRGGGVIIWLSVLICVSLYFLISHLPFVWWLKLFNFLSRKETWLPLFTLISGSLIGLIDDFLTVYGKGKYVGGGMSFKRRFMIVTLIGLIGGWWFYYKLGWRTIHIPLIFNFPEGIDVDIGIFYIPLFVIVMLASWAGGVVDGLDGLAGGVFGAIFGALAIISFNQGKADLATFCAAILGSLFPFLWFNIPPAKFYMGETGVLGLTTTMTVIAFLTDSVLVLPIIAGVLVIEVASIILQLLSKKIRKKKIWLATPIHHHFQARGWPPYQITMRFWILSLVFAFLGLIIRLLS